MPFDKMRNWLKKEKDLGSPNPNNIVLSTTSHDSAHSRIVAIREISVRGILFFTQKGTRKYDEISANPNASMTLWLPLQQREIIVEGVIYFLNQTENESYWSSLPRESQLKFSAYAPSSGKLIASLGVLNEQLTMLTQRYHDQPIPMSSYYVGAYLVPTVFYFYTLRNKEFSDVIKYEYDVDHWQSFLCSP